jgi:cobalt/nickel transport protein
MSPKDKKLLIGGLLIAVVIAFLAPFLASTDPDGLDGTIEKLIPGHESEPVFESPMPDYTIPFLGEDSKLGEVIAIVGGTLVIFLLALGIGKLIKKDEIETSEEKDES